MDPRYYEYGTFKGLRMLANTGGMINIVATDDGEHFYGVYGFVDMNDNNTIRVAKADKFDNHTQATFKDGKLVWDDGDTWEEFYWTKPVIFYVISLIT